MALAIRTSIAPLDWLAALEEDPRLVATALEILEEVAESGERPGKGRGRA